MIIILFTPVSRIFATEIFFETVEDIVRVGNESQIDLMINTEGKTINTIEGKINFDSKIFDIKEIKDGNSVVNFWIEKPNLETGQISFAGIVPGGFSGPRGLVLRIVVVPKITGESQFLIKEAKVLLHDGLGTPELLRSESFNLEVVAAGSGQDTKSLKDNVPPESFRPEIGRDENILNGKWFVVFSTKDKDSKIDHYEVKEVWFPVLAFLKKSQIVESPFVLDDQNLRSYVFVKAVDQSGNYTEAVVAAPNPFWWYENILYILAIIIVIIILVRRFILYRNRGFYENLYK